METTQPTNPATALPQKPFFLLADAQAEIKRKDAELALERDRRAATERICDIQQQELTMLRAAFRRLHLDAPVSLVLTAERALGVSR
jgi:hypothetical protein